MPRETDTPRSVPEPPSASVGPSAVEPSQRVVASQSARFQRTRLRACTAHTYFWLISTPSGPLPFSRKRPLEFVGQGPVGGRPPPPPPPYCSQGGDLSEDL